MIAVIFEVTPKDEGFDEYLEIAASLREELQGVEGFISIERFRSLVDERKVLSLSFWRDEAAVTRWRNTPNHRLAQAKGRFELFESYRLRVAEVARDYSGDNREQVPEDSP